MQTNRRIHFPVIDFLLEIVFQGIAGIHDSPG